MGREKITGQKRRRETEKKMDLTLFSFSFSSLTASTAVEF